MSALATTRSGMETLFDPDDARAFGAQEASWTLDGTRGGGPMLDDLVAGVWEGLAAHRVVQCPVCAAEMQPEYGVHALPLGGRCGSCGSTLR